MNLQDYLQRIHYSGDVNVNKATLMAIHRQHLLHIPWDNLGVMLEEKSDLSLEPSYDKIVTRGRGGWCYETNGLLQWALQEIGFDVMRMSAGVLRSEKGQNAMGTHLALAVTLAGQVWLADAGFGDGFREPVRLQEGAFEQGGLHFALQELNDGYWRFSNHEFASMADFDFKLQPADEDELLDKCLWLQNSDDSPFKGTVVCQKFEPDSIEILIGRLRRRVSKGKVEKWLLNSAEEVNAELDKVFVNKVDISGLWQKIQLSHEAIFAAKERH